MTWGVIVTPGAWGGRTTMLRPLLPRDPGVRASTSSTSALSAWITKSLLPSSIQPPPAPARSSTVTPSTPAWPCVPVSAQAICALPAAMRPSRSSHCAWLPASRTRDAASATVLKNGDAASRRPCSSCRMHSSTQPRPAPPKRSGMASPAQPSSPAICCHSFRS